MSTERFLISSERISVLSNKADIDFCGDLCDFCSLEATDDFDLVSSRRMENTEVYEHDYCRQGGDRLVPFMTATDHIAKDGDAFVRVFEGCDTLKMTLNIRSDIDYETLSDYPIGDVLCDCIYMHSPKGKGLLAIAFGDAVFKGGKGEMRVSGSGGIMLVLGNKHTAVRTASSLIRSINRSQKLAQKREIFPDAVGVGSYQSFIESSVSFLRRFYKNQKHPMSDALYFAIRAFCALGLYSDAKNALCFFRDRFKTAGHFENVFGQNEFFADSGASAYFLLSAEEYFSCTHDSALLKSLLPLIDFAVKSQIRQSRHSLMHPSGSEREFLSGRLPGSNLHCASARSTLLYNRSLLSAANLLSDEKELFTDCAKKSCEAFKASFITEIGARSFASCPEFDRKTRFKAGFCDKCASQGRFVIEILERKGDMRYLCDKCFADEMHRGTSTAPQKADTDILLPYDRCLLFASGYITDDIASLFDRLISDNELDALCILLLHCAKNKLPITESMTEMLFRKMGSDSLLFDGSAASAKANAILCEALARYFKT